MIVKSAFHLWDRSHRKLTNTTLKKDKKILPEVDGTKWHWQGRQDSGRHIPRWRQR